VFQDVQKGLWVTDATKVPVKNIHEVYKLIETGSKNRVTASTLSNAESSRSHALVILTVEKELRAKGVKRAAQLYMVDLCGSEKITKTGA
jgi:kinesin family protein 5